MTEALGLVTRVAGARPAVEQLVLPVPQHRDAQVRIQASGLCHTDLMVTEGVWWSAFPYLLGHEGVGIVERVAAADDEQLVGRRVLIAWRGVCGQCRFCRSGRPRLCADLPVAAEQLRTADGQRVTASLRVGSHAERTLVHAGQLVEVPEDLPAEALSVIGCGMLTGYGAVMHTAAVQPGRSVLVLGCGAVGTAVIQAAAAVAGASRVVAVDTRLDKLELARTMGATDVVLADEHDALRAAVGDGVDYVFDVVGTPATMQQAVECADTGGTCVLIGTPQRGAVWPLALPEMFFKRLRLAGCQYGDVLPGTDVPQIIQHYRHGVLRLQEMVSSVISLPEAPAAMAELGSGRAGLRTVIRLQA